MMVELIIKPADNNQMLTCSIGEHASETPHSADARPHVADLVAQHGVTLITLHNTVKDPANTALWQEIHGLGFKLKTQGDGYAQYHRDAPAPTKPGLKTKTCSRCRGTGRHSYNQRHLDMCYGCQGKGVVLANPKAAGAKITADFRYCELGDVVQVGGIGTCRVVELEQGEFQRRERGFFGGVDIVTYPERVTFESLIDGKRYRTYRHTPERETMLGGRMCRVNKKTCVWHPIESKV